MARHMILCLAFLVVGVAVCSGLYTTVYDDENVDAILASNRLRNSYIQCLLGRGRCDDKGKELKDTLPNAVSGKCDDCSVTQRQNARKIRRYLKKHHPGDWAQVEEMYSIPDFS